MDIIKDNRNKAIKDDIFSINNEIFLTSRTSYPYSFILKKTEKISTALHLLTHDLYEGEPVRQRLRVLSVTLIEHSCALMPGNRGYLLRVAENIDALSGVLSVAAGAGVLHPTLVAVLIDELNTLSEIAQEAFGNAPRHGFGTITGSDYFKVELPTAQVHTAAKREFSIEGNIKDTRSTVSEKNFISKNESSVQYNDREHEVVEKDSSGVRKKDRRAIILTILQTKEHITVKELASVIKDCSEKTLQRELLALVASGVLKKEGERRWSSYSIR